MDSFAGRPQDCLLRPALCDTLYRISTQEESPALVFDPGRFKVSLERKADWQNTKGVLQISRVLTAGDLLFVEIALNNKIYLEIWNISDNTLIYKSTHASRRDRYGFPSSIRGTTVYFWPSYAENDTLYCDLSFKDGAKLLPEVLKDGCPVIVELKMKH